MKSALKKKYHFVFVLITILLISLLVLVKTQTDVNFSPPVGEWKTLNGGLPINALPQIGSTALLQTAALTLNDATYFFVFSQNERFSEIHRFNSSSGSWEILTESGWSNKSFALPQPFSLSESVSKIYPVQFNNSTKIVGAYLGTTSVFPTILDVHGALTPFILESDKIKKWNGSASFDDYLSQPVFISWDGADGGIASDNKETALIVSHYGKSASPDWPDRPRVAAALFNISDSSSAIKQWNGTGWVNWAYDLETYTPLISPEKPLNKSVTTNNPRVAFIPQKNEYLILLDAKYIYDVRLCAVLYKAAEQKMLQWNGTNWSENFAAECADVSSNLINNDVGYGSRRDAVESITSKDDTVSFITSSGSPQKTKIVEVSYNASSSSWTTNALVNSGTVIESATAESDLSGNIWLIFKEKDNQIIKLMKKNISWSQPTQILNTSYPVQINDLEFTKNNEPLLFLSNYDGVFIYSNTNLNNIPVERMIQQRNVDQINTSKISLVKRWENSVQNSIPGSGRFPAGTIAADNESSLFVASPSLFRVNIHHNDSETTTDGNYWGQSWGYFYFPSGIAIDNKRKEVFITDNIPTGGGGSYYYDGKLQIFNLSWKNQSLNYNGYPYTISSLWGFAFATEADIDEEANRLYISEGMRHRILVYNLSQRDSSNFPKLISTIGSYGKNSAQFAFQQGIALDKTTGELYVADSGNHRIQVFDRSGTFLRSFGEFGFGAGQLTYPYLIAVDRELNVVYVTDPWADKVVLYSKTGTFLTEFTPSREFILTNFVFTSPKTNRIGGIESLGKGVFVVGQGADLFKYNITDLRDTDSDKIPDALQVCQPDGCNSNCPAYCASSSQDPDCGIPSCDDNCKNGDETGIDCGGSCTNQVQEICSNNIDDNKNCVQDCFENTCSGEPFCSCADGVCGFGDKCKGDCFKEIQCGDGTDNDGDSYIDCADSDCDGAVGTRFVQDAKLGYRFVLQNYKCESLGETICDDSFDNDGNGLRDCQEDVCQNFCSLSCSDSDFDTFYDKSPNCFGGDDLDNSTSFSYGSINATTYPLATPYSELYETINFENLTDFRLIENFSIKYAGKTRIQFIKNISLVPLDSEYAYIVYTNINLDDAISVTDNSISINTRTYRNFRKPAYIYFYRQFSNFQILRDGNPCDEVYCTLSEVTQDYVKIKVKTFSNYSIIKIILPENNSSNQTPSVQGNSGGGAGGGGGGTNNGNYDVINRTIQSLEGDCVPEWSCVWSQCQNNTQNSSCRDLTGCSQEVLHETRDCQIQQNSSDQCAPGFEDCNGDAKTNTAILLIILFTILFVILVIKLKKRRK